MNRRNNRILYGCFAISLLFHVLSLVFLQRYSLWFSSPQKYNEVSGWLSLVDKKERDEILQIAFEGMEEGEGSAIVKKEKEKPIHLRSSLPTAEHESAIHFSLPNITLATTPAAIPKFTMPSDAINLLDHLPKELALSSSNLSSFLPTPHTAPLLLGSASLSFPKEFPSAALQPPPASTNATLTETANTACKPTLIALPQLSKIPTLAELDTASYSDSFDTDLVFLPKEDESGYIFALTLIPERDLELPRIKQHFTFLIDRSNSVQQGRLNAAKAAVHRALDELLPEDTFNIIAFDSKLDKMSPNPVACSNKSKAMAESFLEKIHLGSFFASGDLYKPLLQIVPYSVEQDELHTAIILTDGESLNKKSMQKAVLHHWTQYNQGKISLYAIGMNQDPHIGALDIATLFNRGKLTHVSTTRGMKRKLLKLLKTVQNPIAKDIGCKAISKSPHAHISLFSDQMAHLYLDQPYVILGETDTLDDFILFVQGKLKDRWLNIKKTITFLNAKKGNKALKEEYALHQAYHLYERYVADDNPKHLAEANLLIEPYHHKVALQ